MLPAASSAICTGCTSPEPPRNVPYNMAVPEGLSWTRNAELVSLPMQPLFSPKFWRVLKLKPWATGLQKARYASDVIGEVVRLCPAHHPGIVARIHRDSSALIV